MIELERDGRKKEGGNRNNGGGGGGGDGLLHVERVQWSESV